MGVNQGRLGFLTDISIDTMFETIGSILDGSYVTEERMLLKAEVISSERTVFDVLAFNDAVVTKGIKGSMIEFEVKIDGKYLYTLRSDGFIVATEQSRQRQRQLGPWTCGGVHAFQSVLSCCLRTPRSNELNRRMVKKNSSQSGS